MTKEFARGISYDDLSRAYAAYNQLMIIYENTCGGPYGARNYKEYFAICDSRDNIRQEVLNRSKIDGDGNGQ